MTIDSTYPEFFAGLRDYKLNGTDKATALCPAHDDTRHSLSIGLKSNGDLLFNCLAGCSFGAILYSIDVKSYQIRNPNTRRDAVREYEERGTPVATYTYTDAKGQPVYRIDRHHKPKKGGGYKKQFLAFRKVGDSWKYGLEDVPRTLYRLPDLIARPDEVVYLVEGEKDADNLRELGFLATTNAFGAGVWTLALADLLRDRDVVISVDNDPPNEDGSPGPGLKGATDRARTLDGVAKSVRLLEIPGLPEKGDVSDFIEAGNGADEIRSVVEKHAVPYSREEDRSEVEKRAEGFKAHRGDKDPTRIARLLIAEQFTSSEKKTTLKTWRGSFWTHEKNHYRQISEADFRYGVVWKFCDQELERQNRLAIAENNGDKVPKTASTTEGLVSNILGAIRAETQVGEHEERFPFWTNGREGEFLALKNGILDLGKLLKDGTLELLPHSPDWFSPIVLPYGYEPGADLSIDFMDYLTTVMKTPDDKVDHDRINLIQEWFGYCLLSTNKLQKFLVLEGMGANGKSVLCEILTSLVGSENVSNIALELFASRFSLVGTIGKLVNISADTSEIDKAAEGQIKQFTSGDRMTFERKMEQSFSAYPTARLVVAWNNRPRFSDKSDGLWRRMILLPFNTKIEQKDRRAEYTDPGWWIKAGHMPGILNWSLLGLQRLFENGKFTDPEICKASLGEFRLESNPAEVFIRENYIEAEECSVSYRETYDAYRTYCNANGYHPTNSSNFGREFRRLFPKAVKRRMRDSGERVYCYSGVGVHPLHTIGEESDE